MKTKLGFILTILLVSTILFAACAVDGENSTLETEENVPLLPVIGFDSMASNTRAITVSIADDDFGYFIYSPILTGWKTNSIGVKANNTYSESFLGKTVDIKVTENSATGIITFNGTVTDNCGAFTLLFDPSTKKFSYEHDIFLYMTEGESTSWLRCEFSDVQLDSQNYFHTKFNTYFMEWTQEDSDTGDIKIAKTTGAEFYYGPSKTDSAKTISGWAWTSANSISVPVNLAHAPGTADTDSLQDFIKDPTTTWPDTDAQYTFAYHNGTEFTDSIGGETPASLDALKSILPWTLLP